MQGRSHAPTVLQTLRHAASVAAALALVLISAPLPRAMRAECDLCPPSCPMHRHHQTGPQGGNHGTRLKCHGGMAARQRGEAGKGPRLSCPQCGNHVVANGPVQPPMILPHGTIRQQDLRAERAALGDLTVRGRLADPPDRPPPIRLV